MEEKKTEKGIDLSEELIEQMVNNLIGYSELNGNLLDKFQEPFFLSYFDRFRIEEASLKFPSQQEINLEEFIKIFLIIIEHKPFETIYLALNLIDLYGKIKE